MYIVIYFCFHMHADPPTKRHSILTRRHLGLSLIACLFECSLVFVIVKKDRIFFGFICFVQRYAQYCCNESFDIRVTRNKSINAKCTKTLIKREKISVNSKPEQLGLSWIELECDDECWINILGLLVNT